ncbi:MAG: NAD(P)-dependent glycerol-3-phosphate dehydrogenase [Streptomycetaceae bacterium]|nr:MAG: NAD(P)-dependent glycerol-3-phosphate dehydrogenase [Streptomycetaceae bacterium]
MTKVTVLGSGAWGTTMAQVLCDAGNDVLMWGRNQGVVEEVNSHHTNKNYLPDIDLPHSLVATSDIDKAFAHSKIYVLAVPAQVLRSNLQEWKPLISSDAILISTLKGIEFTTQFRMSEVIHDVLAADESKIAIITGPNLALELARREPAGAVAAAASDELAHQMQKLFTTSYYRVYASTDILGCEMAGAVKSVIALGVGMAVGLDLGENTQAMLITRGLNEVARLAVAHGADPLSIAGLAGMGDLVASCSSPLSRNRSFGEAISRGGSMEYARALVGTTVEGVASASAVVELAHRVGVEVPVIEAVADVVAGLITTQEALIRLMGISTRSEDFIK